MRAREPDREGTVERDGVRLAYEVFGADHDPTVLLMPTWSIIHSRFWKLQVPYLSRHYRVVTFDGRGSGRSDRPDGAAAYAEHHYADDAAAVMDATGTERGHGRRAVLRGDLRRPPRGPPPRAGRRADRDRRRRAGSASPTPSARPFGWDAELDTTEGWAKYNRRHWLEATRATTTTSCASSSSRCSRSPTRSKQIEDCVGWGHEIDPRTLADTTAARLGCDGVTCTPAEDLCRQVRCPVVVVHGTDDRIRPHTVGVRLAELTGGSLVTVEGGGHGPQNRDPVFVNRLIRDVVERTRADHRPDPHLVDPRPAPAEAGAVPLVRRSASATPGATSPSPASCARTTPTSRSTGWPSTPSPPCSRRPASGCTRRRPGWPASRPTSRTSATSTTSTPSRPSGGWTRSSSTTSWSSTTSSRPGTTTW